MNATFTKQEFYDEICRFRALFGSKEWWNKPLEVRDACVRGLSHMYFNIMNEDGTLPTQEEIEKYALVFDATMVEYYRRATMLGKLT